MKKPITIGVMVMIVIISLANSSFAQTESPNLPTEKEPIQVVESIEQVDDTIGEEVSLQMDEEAIQALDKSIQDITNILPYLGIIIAGIIVGIIVIKKRNKEDDKDSEDYEFYDDEEKGLTPRSKPMGTNFQEMQEDSQLDNIDDIDPEQIIENKLRIISKLQEFKIGDNHKLEEIKQLLIADSSFTQEANDYLEAKYEEYKKIAETDSDE